MSHIKPVVICIAGFDPSGGAGLLADVKTVENNSVYAMGVCTAITVQTENKFESVHWTPIELIIEQLNFLMAEYSVAVFKIGLIRNSADLKIIINHIIEKKPAAKIIWDPIIKSSSGFSFHNEIDFSLNHIYLVTPNYYESKVLFKNADENILMEFSFQTNILLKGGHNQEIQSNDVLFENGVKHDLKSDRILFEKHGSGCVLSSAIAAQLANNRTLKTACEMAKRYTYNYLKSHESLLGWHHSIEPSLIHE